MTVPESKPILNGQKRITLTHIAGRRWDVEIEGAVTRRDILKLQRVLHVEFAKVMRRRSVQRLMLDRVKSSPQQKDKLNVTTTKSDHR